MRHRRHRRNKRVFISRRDKRGRARRVWSGTMTQYKRRKKSRGNSYRALVRRLGVKRAAKQWRKRGRR